MQLCNRIYCSKVYWRLNMFRAAHRSSSRALNCICSLWLYTHVVTGRCQGWVGNGISHFPFSLGNERSPHGYINQRLQIQFKAPDDERCARSKHVEPSINFVIINFITKLYLVGISSECLCFFLQNVLAGALRVQKGTWSKRWVFWKQDPLLRSSQTPADGGKRTQTHTTSQYVSNRASHSGGA